MNPSPKIAAANAIKAAGLAGKTWTTAHGPLTSEMLARALGALLTERQIARPPGFFGISGAALGQAMDCWSEHGASDRRVDRGLQILKKAGLIRFDWRHRAWFPVDAKGEA